MYFINKKMELFDNCVNAFVRDINGVKKRESKKGGKKRNEKQNVLSFSSLIGQLFLMNFLHHYIFTGAGVI